MNYSAITVRYAKAFFSIAKEKNLLTTLKADMELVLDICKSSEDFIHLLESPVVKISKKTTIIESIFANRLDAITLRFLSLIIENKREVYIPGICRNFIELIRKEKNIKSAMITTATELNVDTLKKVEQLLSKELKANVELSSQINPDIIGGMVLRLDNKQYDASVATQLKRVKEALLETEL